MTICKVRVIGESRVETIRYNNGKWAYFVSLGRISESGCIPDVKSWQNPRGAFRWARRQLGRLRREVGRVVRGRHH